MKMSKNLMNLLNVIILLIMINFFEIQVIIAGKWWERPYDEPIPMAMFEKY
jgi:hypothetical protein